MALLMKSECERCAKALDMLALAYICSYECTFCDSCAKEMNSICPNCQGNLVIRPKRKLST